MSQDTLKQLALLCQQLRDAEQACETLSGQLGAKEAECRRIAEEDIPALMTELGVQKIKLETGEEIKVGLEVYAAIPAAFKDEAFKWLEDNGHGGLIKTQVSAVFGKGELEEAKLAAQRFAESTGKPVEIGRSVHASTLKSFLKEQIAAAAEIPLELFGARPVNTAKIK